MRLYIATANQGKQREFARILAPHGLEILTLRDLDHPPDIVEDGATFADNATKKARSLHQLTGQPTLADDSGLVVDALHGAPGVHSARYAGHDGPDRDAVNRAKLLRELAGVADEERTARFVCALVYIDAQGGEHLFTGTCEGRIGHVEVGEGGFGYDSIFIDPQRGQTFAQLSADDKAALSHRGRAVRAFLDEHMQACQK